MNVQQLGLLTGAALTALVFLTACSGSREPGPDPSLSAAPPVDQAEARSPKALLAEEVKTDLEKRLGVHESEFGSGTGSACSTRSATMFTQECATTAAATAEDAAFALTKTEGHEGFATLRSVAAKIQTSVSDYRRLKCASGPENPEVRDSCLAPAAVIAGAFPELRGGANLGLAGK
ncbi:hypothetical protein SRB5_24720 [Streptomyces sp. RB5]|uniref:Uncharacterized protein n=1 Tax=Streptomyces smaragdinus TaxID=2585196 RepID=A0A7K0CFT8_9ACTN|nr:hypothetical protein [Streptomyces smaragdinus]MQY12339.1 hypothetical protein [Streptomyces smaragdinus]